MFIGEPGGSNRSWVSNRSRGVWHYCSNRNRWLLLEEIRCTSVYVSQHPSTSFSELCIPVTATVKRSHLCSAVQDNRVISYCRTMRCWYGQRSFAYSDQTLWNSTSTDSSWPVAVTDSVLRSTKFSHVLQSTMIHSHSASVTVYRL